MRRPPRSALARLALAAGLGLALVPSCAEPGDDASDPWARGARLVARTATLDALLARLADASDTPLARRAAALRERLPDCAALEARASHADLGALLSDLRCRPALTPGDVPWRAPRPSDLAFALPLAAADDADREAPAARIRGALVADARGDVDLELELPAARFRGARGWLLPGREPAGPPRLSRTDELVHVRLRPDAPLDLAAWLSADGQAARLFHLKSRLFSAAVLDGTWEAALYLPEPGRRMPGAALALGVRQRAAAVAAMEAFLHDVARRWPVRREPFALGAGEGACLPDLKLLPELAPCYVATRDALAIGWNPASLRRALDGNDGGAEGAIVELARFAEADARLAGREGGDAVALPWRRLTARGRHAEQSVHLQLRLEGGNGA